MTEGMIAIVNSDQTLLNLLQELLADVGHESTIYLTGPDVYHHIRQTQPPLVILDVGLLGAAAGWPLLKLLQLDPQTMHIPVLVTTVDHKVVVEKAEHLQAQGYDVLELPAPFAELCTKVEKLIGPS